LIRQQLLNGFAGLVVLVVTPPGSMPDEERRMRSDAAWRVRRLERLLRRSSKARLEPFSGKLFQRKLEKTSAEGAPTKSIAGISLSPANNELRRLASPP
jgi:hypothetical protein